MVTDVPGEPATADVYRRLAVPTASGGSCRVVVVVHHATDSAAESGIDAMRALAGDGHVKPVLIASVSSSGDEKTSTLDRESPEIGVRDALARTGHIDRLDIVSVFADVLLDPQAADSLIAATAELVQDCRLLAPRNTLVQDCRMAFPAHGGAAQLRFGGGSKRIVVVPEDRRLPSSMARPLDASDPAAFGMHIAVETISVCGLWTTTDDDLLGRQSPADAKPELVRVARSMVRSVRLTCPPPTDWINLERRLPVPAQAKRATQPQKMAKEAAELLVPGRLRPPPADQPPDTSTAGSSFFGALFKRMAGDLLAFPRRARDGLSDELERLVDDMAEAIVSESPEIGNLWDHDDSPETDEAKSIDHTPHPAELSCPDDWSTLVQATLGVADRATLADDIRAQAAASRDQVLSSLEHLVGAAEPATLAEVFTELAGIDDDPGQGADTAGDDDREAQRAAAATGGNQRSGQDVDDDEDVQASALLPTITADLRRHKHEARQRVERCHEKLSEASPDQQREAVGTAPLSAAVPICLAAGALLAVIAWAVLFPPLSDAVAIGNVVTDPSARARLWILPTGALAWALLVINMPRDNIRQQRYLILGTTAVIAGCATLLIWPSPVEPLVRTRLGGSSGGSAALLAFAAILICTVNATGRGLAKTRQGRWSSALSLLYLTAITVAVLNDEGTRPDLLDDYGTRLLVIGTVVAGALILTSYSMVSVAWQRREQELDRWRESVEWWSGQHEKAQREAGIRDSVYTHWLGSACALHRIFRHPYGTADWPSLAQSAHDDGHRVGAVGMALVKAAFVECIPTAAGRERFGKILQAEMIRPGWLYAQYHRAAEAYRSRNGAVPEACSYPLRLSEGLLTTDDGDRWPFVQQLYRGDFDQALMERVTDFVDGDGLDELFNDVASFQVAPGAHADQSPLAVLAEIAHDPDPPIPPTLLDPAARIERGNELTMKSYLWWPERLAAVTPTAIEATETPSPRSRGVVTHQAVRVDLSEPILLRSLSAANGDPTGEGGAPLTDRRDL